MKFAIRDLLWLTLVIALFFAWRVERQSMIDLHSRQVHALKRMVVESDLDAQEAAARIWDYQQELDKSETEVFMLRGGAHRGRGMQAIRPRPVPKPRNPATIYVPSE